MYVINRGTTLTKGMIIGEAPGADEEREGKPFVGKAGQLLESVFNGLGDSIDNYYVTNVYKLRPPGNRTPLQSEILAHKPALEEEIRLVHPSVILALGNVPFQTLLSTTLGITKARGGRYTYMGKIEVVPCFHPAYILRQPGKIDKFENDIMLFRKLCGKKCLI